MNEIIFLTQSLIIVSFALAAWKMGHAALTAWVAIQAVIANLFVLKQISLFGFEVTASDAFAIGSLLGLNLLQEHFGKEEAIKATWICFLLLFFFAVVSQLHLLFEPSFGDRAHPAFEVLLSPSPRIFLASLSVFFAVQQFDVRFFLYLKKQLPRVSFAGRAALALMVSQGLDTVLFSFAGLYGLVASITDIIIVSYIVKLAVIFCFSSIVKWAKA